MNKEWGLSINFMCLDDFGPRQNGGSGCNAQTRETPGLRGESRIELVQRRNAPVNVRTTEADTRFPTPEIPEGTKREPLPE